MGDELGRKAAIGLLFLGSGAVVVAALALTGWLLVRVVRTRIAERRARQASADIGVREINAPRRASDSGPTREERSAAEVRRPAA